MKFLLLLVVGLSIGLTGCATDPNYKLYLENNSKQTDNNSLQVIAKENALAEKYKAMAVIAASGTETAKVAAVMAMALGNQSIANQYQLNPVQAPQNQALQWASILLPSITQIAGIAYNSRVAEVQSNNSRDVALSTNGAFSSMGNSIQATANSGFNSSQLIATGGFNNLTNMAGLIQAPAANVTNTFGGDGVIGSGTITKPTTTTTTTNTTTTTDNHAINPSTIVPAGKVCSIDAGIVNCK